MAPSSAAELPVRIIATYRRATGLRLRKTRLIARIDRNYELVFAVVTGGALLAIVSGVLLLAVSVIG